MCVIYVFSMAILIFHKTLAVDTAYFYNMRVECEILHHHYNYEIQFIEIC